MCGRYVLEADETEIKKEFDAVVEKIQEDLGEEEAEKVLSKRYNIAPTQVVAAVRQIEGERIISGLKWGLVPAWAKEESIGNRMINARAESLTEKPSFRNAFRSRRCIVPASGFYEWKRLGEKGGKQPYYFYFKDKPVFGFAGLWESWKTEDGRELETCTIITTEANAVLKPIHDRMPVILKLENYEQWLNPKEMDTDKLQKLLVPCSSEEMNSHPVSRAVNSPASVDAGLIKAVELNSK